MKNEQKKLKALITMCWIVLFAIWLICFLSGERLNVVIHNEKLLEIGNFIDNTLYLKYPLKFLSYYLNTILVIYAILKKKLFSCKVIEITIYSIIIWSIKIIFIDFAFIDYIDFVSIVFIIIIDKHKTLRAIIGNILLFIFVFISAMIKNFLKINVANLPFVIQSALMIDVIIMCAIYYMYSRKEETNDERYGLVLFKGKILERCKCSFRKFISSCNRSYRNFISSLKTNAYKTYCGIVFFIITYGSILIVGYFMDRMIEVSISIICFHIFRQFDDKTFHASTCLKCWCISTITFIILMRLTLPLINSMLSSIMLSYILTKTMYLIQDYLDLKIERANMIKSTLEEVSEEDLIHICNQMKVEDVKLVYKYLHQNKIADIFCMNNGISRRTLFRYLKQVREIYKEFKARE